MSMICPNCSKENKHTAKFCNGCGGDLQDFIDEEPLEVGVILENRYKIITQLNCGGMSTIYKAKVLKLNSICAVKELLPPEGTIHEQAEAASWFNREAKILAKLDHPNLPKVFDYFVNKGRYYLVMNFIEGDDLDTILEKDGNPGLPEEKVVGWAKELLEVLDYLHNQDPPIVYRDIKPANIMLHKDGRVMLIDFGIARIVRDQDISAKTVIGTDGYAPLEQYEGQPEPRSDLYALGATMYHLLTGKMPLPLNIPPVKEAVPNISEKLNEAITKATQRNGKDRFAGAKEMLEAFNSIYGASEEKKEASEEKEKIKDPEKKEEKSLPPEPAGTKSTDLFVNSLFGKTFRTIYFFDLNNGWTVGDEGMILYGTNVGMNWSGKKNESPANLYDIHFVSAKKGWAAGCKGTIIHSSNGGKTWEIQKIEGSSRLYGIHFVSEDKGWAVGEGGTIVHTENGGSTGWLSKILSSGKSWKKQSSGTTDILCGVHFADENNGWAIGRKGTILSTVNGGVNWKKKKANKTFTDVCFASKYRGWITGEEGTILYTTDGGGTWKSQDSKTKSLLTSVSFFDENNGWISGITPGLCGIILYTKDGGNSWIIQKDNIPAPLVSIYFLNLYNGWALTNNGMIFHTSNGGKDWKSGQKLCS